MKTKITILILSLACAAQAQFGRTTDSYFPQATSIEATNWFLLNKGGTNGYNLSASNTLSYLRGLEPSPYGTVWKGTVSTNAVYTNSTPYWFNLKAAFQINNPVNLTNAIEFWCDYDADGDLDFMQDSWVNNNNAYMETRIVFPVEIPPGVGYAFIYAADASGNAQNLTNQSYGVYR